jgi:hypothetical protein
MDLINVIFYILVNMFSKKKFKKQKQCEKLL